METIQNTNKSSSFHPVIERLFKSRDMSPEDIKNFLSWDLKELPDLTNLIDLTKTSQRIIDAINNNEKIAIYGDYDVDGTTSCALFYQFFKMLNTEVELIQPSRFIEGYGIHPPAVEKAHEKGIKLLITVDCGITNNEAADKAKEIGIDLIITDHHKDARDKMPDAYAIVNPNRRDEEPGNVLAPLAGVTVAFCVCLKVKMLLEKEGRAVPSIYPLLQYAAIGTICDLANLTPVNLKIVRHGLKQIRETKYSGLRQFFTVEERKLPIIPSEKLSFNIGPLINSKGRLDHPEKALQLLIAEDSDYAFECYSHLEISNKERKRIQSEVAKEAKEQVLKQLQSKDHYISIVYAPHWHEGVIGIVASRLVEEFSVPAIVFTNSEEEGIIKASARSTSEFNIFNLLNENSDLFNKFGGHKAAAGLSMPKENFEKLKLNANEYLKKIPEVERTNRLNYDLEIKASEINPKLVKELELLEPFGMGNGKPIFKVTDFKLDSYDLLKEVHVRWNFSAKDNPKHKVKGISFNYVGKYGHKHPEDLIKSQNHFDEFQKEELTVYFTLGINRFRGNEYIQLMIERID